LFASIIATYTGLQFFFVETVYIFVVCSNHACKLHQFLDIGNCLKLQ